MSDAASIVHTFVFFDPFFRKLYQDSFQPGVYSSLSYTLFAWMLLFLQARIRYYAHDFRCPSVSVLTEASWVLTTQPRDT
ncbi:uncharacterized protein ARMOST_20293 [Armillaria ostoyae]|uniref:Uncharacterized protein n=1 Tax=Armillaria ostoyae TaxID=47428 RepID=A0A284S6Z0_ARMOS|nr:uncharacterized protein ARMOST_20293 [Armillaria ostoyae]